MHSKDRSVELNTSKVGDWGEFSLMEVRSGKERTAKDDGEVKDAEKDETSLRFGPKWKF